MAASDRLTITAGAALQLIDASSRGPIDNASACITFTGDTTEYTYTQLGKGLAKSMRRRGAACIHAQICLPGRTKPRLPVTATQKSKSGLTPLAFRLAGR